jgi:hypothetical protein
MGEVVDEQIVRDVVRQLLPSEFSFAIQYAISFDPTDKFGHTTLILKPEEWTALTMLAKAYPECCSISLEAVASLTGKLTLMYRPIKIVPCEKGFKLTSES